MSDTNDNIRWFTEDGSGFHLKEFPDTAGLKSINENTRIVLAMNDICCELQIGRVYVLFSHPPAGAHSDETLLALSRIPKVFYVPECWTLNDQRDWFTKGWRWQISRVCARHGWLEEVIPVLPFRLQYQTVRRIQPQIEALSLGHVQVYLAPIPYIMLYEEMEAVTTLARKRQGSKRWVMDVNSWDDLEEWRCTDIKMVMKRLDELFWAEAEPGNSRTVFYGQLLGRFTEVGFVQIDSINEVVGLIQDHSTRPGNSDEQEEEVMGE